MTIKQELEKIANACITSQEFTERAKSYLKETKGIKQKLMSDGELRDIYREVDRKREIEKCWEKYKNTIHPALNRRPDCKGLWYEVWIDLDECWEGKWFSSFRFMKDEDIIEVCAKYLNEQERFYSSPDYTDMLDKMVENIKFD
jgi:hypothetical protein